MAKSFLPSGVENRLKVQSEILHRLAMRDAEEKRATRAMPFVTLSRQYGCMAYVLADRLAQRLDEAFPEWHFTIYDREALEQMVAHKAITADVINSLSERTRGFIEDGVGQLVSERPTETRVFHYLARTLCSIAALGQAILIGCGGAAITRKIPTGIHVRLVASVDWRVENLGNYPDRVDEASVQFVRQADKKREGFVRKYLGADVNDPALYHLILNNQLLSLEEQVEILTKLVTQRCSAA